MLRRNPVSNRPTTRLNLERLEDRLAPATRLVVAAGMANGTTSFASLQAALTTAGLAAGDIIQIEPGSTPGDVTSNPTTVNNLTIQGNPTTSLSAIPTFTVSGVFTVAAGQTGFTLNGVNAQLTGAGAFDFGSNATIIGARLEATGTANNAINLTGLANSLTGNTFVANSSSLRNLIRFVAAADTSNSFLGNTVIGTSIFATGNLVAFAPTTSITTTDVVANNHFIANGANSFTMVRVNPGGGGTILTGLTVRDNLLENLVPTAAVFGIWTESQTRETIIRGNRIRFPGAGEVAGILIFGNNPTGNTINGATVDGNYLSVPAGLGLLAINSGATLGDILNVPVQANILHGSNLGIVVATKTGGTNAVDLGGGAMGSRGGNNFRAYTAQATGAAGGLITSDVNTATLTAMNNLFANGVTPGTVVFANPGASPIDVSNPLTGNAAFVSSLYASILHRAGDLSNVNDAGGWVNALGNGMTRAQVVDGIMRSTESVNYLVDRLYLNLLGRSADTAGRNNFAALLATGWSLEATIPRMLGSTEYVRKQGSDTAFIESLYTELLGRSSDTAGLANWMTMLGTQGRAAVIAGFVNSLEFRTSTVQNLFGFQNVTFGNLGSLFTPLLHRATAPTTTEVNTAVNSNLDLMRVFASFASSDEYFANG